MTECINSPKPKPTGKLLRERELAERWKTSLRTLQRWRAQRSGPAYVRIGRSIRYRICDIEAFEERGWRDGEEAGLGGA